MTGADFRRIALSFDGAEERSHMDAVDFRVGGRIFATLASVRDGFGNLALTPEIQAEFVAEAPDLFVPVPGGWGRMGATHVRLAKADRDTLTGALHAAWKLRVDKNAATRLADARVGRADEGSSRRPKNWRHAPHPQARGTALRQPHPANVIVYTRERQPSQSSSFPATTRDDLY